MCSVFVVCVICLSVIHKPETQTIGYYEIPIQILAFAVKYVLEFPSNLNCFTTLGILELSSPDHISYV